MRPRTVRSRDMARLPAGVDEAALVRAAAAGGIGSAGARETYADAAVPGIVFGYATMSERRIGEALREVSEALDGS